MKVIGEFWRQIKRLIYICNVIRRDKWIEKNRRKNK